MDFRVKKGKKREKKEEKGGCPACGGKLCRVRVIITSECEGCGRKKARSVGMRALNEGERPVMRE